MESASREAPDQRVAWKVLTIVSKTGTIALWLGAQIGRVEGGHPTQAILEPVDPSRFNSRKRFVTRTWPAGPAWLRHGLNTYNGGIGTRSMSLPRHVGSPCLGIFGSKISRAA